MPELGTSSRSRVAESDPSPATPSSFLAHVASQ